MPRRNALTRSTLSAAALAAVLTTGRAAQAQRPDLSAYGAIRHEGFAHSHVMELAEALTDGIGPRLTGSPNLAKATAWARATMSAMGLSNVHLEDWGEFGVGWEQVNAWAAMTTPDHQPLWLQAAPWSAPTPGPVTASVALVDPSVLTPADIEKLRGTLKGKIVLLGPAPMLPQPVEPFSYRYSDAELKAQESGVGQDPSHRLHSSRGKVLGLLRTEGVVAIIEPSRASQRGGETGMIIDDNGSNLVNEPWNAAKAAPIPHAVMVDEHFGRLARLVQHGVPVLLQLNIETRTTGDHQHGYNLLGDIPGTDPRLKAQVVLVGGHFDSWAAGTGATDNGAGVVVGMEAMRILKAIGARPRRTIRLALWTGEEQGLYGSRGYVRDHLGVFGPSPGPVDPRMPAWMAPHGALSVKSEWKTFDAYFNLDDGAGRVRGIYSAGDLAAGAVLKTWIAPLNDLGVTTIGDGDGDGSDEEAFDAVGVPSFAFIQDPLDYETRAHHSNLDTFERLNEADLEQAAVVEATFLLDAAQRDAMLPRKTFPHPEAEAAASRPLSAFPGAETKP